MKDNTRNYESQTGYELDDDSLKSDIAQAALFTRMEVGVQLSLAIILNKLGKPTKDITVGLREYVNRNLIGTMFMFLEPSKIVAKVSNDKEALERSCAIFTQWLNNDAFKEYNKYVDQLFLTTNNPHDKEEQSVFILMFSKAMSELKTYFVTHPIFAAIVLQNGSVSEIEQDFKQSFTTHYQNVDCECENCKKLKNYFSI